MVIENQRKSKVFLWSIHIYKTFSNVAQLRFTEIANIREFFMNADLYVE